MNFDNVNHIAIPEGTVKRITSGGVELWNADYLRIPSLLLDGYNIDTGVLVPTGGDTELVIDMVCPDSSISLTGNSICGGVYDNGNAGSWYGGDSRNRWTIGGTLSMDVSIFTRTIVKIVYNRDTLTQSLYLNSSLASSRTMSSNAHTAIRTKPLRIGKVRPMTFPLSVFSAKVYSLGTLILDLIPVRRRSDNAECMLDTLSGNFYTKNLYN